MKITTHVDDAVAAACRLQVAGELDMGTADELRTTIGQALTGGVDRVVVDLDALSFCDSSGVTALVESWQQATASGAVLQVANARGMVRRVLDITGVLDTLTDPG